MRKYFLIFLFLLFLIGIFILFKKSPNSQNIKPINIEKKDIDIKIKEKDEFGRKIVQTRDSDPDCTEGVFEYIYYGEIKEDMPVKVILSCDQERFNIVGSVSQIIDSKNKDDMPQDDSFNSLADISSGSQVVDIADDYNFDGYNDLSSISSNGQGLDGVKSFNIFLYSSKTQKFVFNPELSKLQNISVDSKNKLVLEVFGVGFAGKGEDELVDIVNKHKWVNGHLVKVK